MILWICGCSSRVPTSYLSGIKYRFILATEVEGRTPLNNQQVLNLKNGESIYFWSKLFDINSYGDLEYRCVILDADDNIITKQSAIFKVNSQTHVQICKTTPNIFIDKSGTWSFLGYVNGKLVINEKRKVLFKHLSVE